MASVQQPLEPAVRTRAATEKPQFYFKNYGAEFVDGIPALGF
jgi:hypothetical protein